MSPAVQQRTHIVSFNMPKPAHLPFHVLAWGQFFVQAHNCPPPDASEAYIEEFKSKGFLSAKILSGKDQAYVDRYHICTVNVFKNHHGIPFNATYHPPAVPVSSSYPSHLIGHPKVEMSSRATASAHLGSIPLHASKDPILFVYYTECDQVVRFDSLATRDMVVAASNDTTFFVGRRREKVAESSEEDYMAGLNIYMTCGARGYSLLWPRDKLVQIES